MSVRHHPHGLQMFCYFAISHQPPGDFAPSHWRVRYSIFFLPFRPKMLCYLTQDVPLPRCCSTFHLLGFVIFNLISIRRRFLTKQALYFSTELRSSGSVVNNTLDYQSRDREIDPPLLLSFGSDFKPRSRLRMTLLVVGRKTRVHSLTH